MRYLRILGRSAALAGLLAMFAGPARQAGAVGCDYTGFDQPCQVADGVYRVLAPEGKGPFPVLVYLYGSGGHSVTITSHPLFQQTIVDRGYMLVVPAARDMTYVGGVRDTGWALRHEARRARDEVAFLRQVLDNVSRRFPIDRDRILIAGQSRGGFLAWEIACHAPDLGSAFAAHAAGYLGPLPSHCQRPVRMLDAHGIADQMVPFEGQRVFSGGAPLAALEASLDLIARTNRCREPAEDAEPSDFYGFARTSWPGCSRGSGLDLLLHAGGHMMPWIWFRAVLDWFEETPAAAVAAKPVTRTLGGERPAGLFKAPPAPGEAALAPAAAE